MLVFLLVVFVLIWIIWLYGLFRIFYVGGIADEAISHAYHIDDLRARAEYLNKIDVRKIFSDRYIYSLTRWGIRGIIPEIADHFHD